MIPVRTLRFMQAAGGQVCALTSCLHYRRAPALHNRPSPFDASGTISVIDTATNKIIATIAVGKRPWNMAITANGSSLYVANGRSNSESVIDTLAMTELKQIPVGERPWGAAIR